MTLNNPGTIGQSKVLLTPGASFYTIADWLAGDFVFIYLIDMKALRIPESFRIESRTVRYLLYALFGVIVADGLITQFLVTGGHGSEANPFLSAWVGHGWFLVIKVGGAFLATLLLWINYNKKPRAVYTITVVFLLFYTVVVFWNLFVCFLAC
jgi:hypothetical protein